MQLRLFINVEKNPLLLPISYHHILQSMFYSLMSIDDMGCELHDRGFDNGKRTYKLFTFGQIQGKYQIRDKKITFYENITIEFRSIHNDIVMTIAKNIEEYGVKLGNNLYPDVSYNMYSNENTQIDCDRCYIEMISPICVYQTDPELRKTHYFNTSDDEFYQIVNNNFRRKYEAAFGKIPISDIELLPYRISARDKYFTKYKNFYIEAYKGKYILSGELEYLRFLYNVGLGGKNSQGFGMFAIIET